jgi:single-stranded-DNA-specific exonuclease
METEWIFASVDENQVRRLQREAGLSGFLSRLLVARGISTAEEARGFLDSPLAALPAPHDMMNMAGGAQIVWDHVSAGRRVAVYGDYDVDGICSAAIITHFLRGLGAEVSATLASRFDYGYGLGPDQARRIEESGAACAVIVDCGTSDLGSVSYLESKGIRTVVIDHHRVAQELPPASAFINPQQPGCPFPAKALTASGLCFYFVAVMMRRGGERCAGDDARDYLDLAAIGTVADVAPMTGANRCITKNGARRMLASKRPALVRMLAAAGAGAGRRPEEVISFFISPLLNAAGRMGDPMLALELLLARDEAQARQLHEKVALLNERRREEEKRVTDEARFLLTKKDTGGRSSFLLRGKGWHPGVLGIVASRLVERCGCPVGVIGVEGGLGRGSIRAPEGINLFSPLSQCRDLFERFGGHSAAMGFTIRAGKIPLLEEKLEQICAEMGRGGSALTIDAVLSARELGWSHLEESEKLSPFGAGNPSPVICLRDLAVEDARIVGSNHLKGFISFTGRRIPLFGPNMGDRLASFHGASRLAGNLRSDTYRGGQAIEFILKDFK